ncbi:MULTISPECIES: hypothetical protein [Alicyclobacillaceae]|uniref:Uncharacterized protein n=1 Tax=Ferroacidibacillus organovorans TaxID=1765683 RepID=A0A1V4ET68_9BACL|nr:MULTISPECIES: hypothetical protein [Alicyclobacillaceae]OPG16052.1 hypothetical protein B2M26_08370 [Ferroacidibacillus organovorans]
MCDLTLALLAEKLIDDFYDTDGPSMGGAGNTEDDIKEQLKALVPKDKWNLLFLWEAQTAEAGGEELRRFAVFVARMMLGVTDERIHR